MKCKAPTNWIEMFVHVIFSNQFDEHYFHSHCDFKDTQNFVTSDSLKKPVSGVQLNLMSKKILSCN